jgi:hypothetical protein
LPAITNDISAADDPSIFATSPPGQGGPNLFSVLQPNLGCTWRKSKNFLHFSHVGIHNVQCHPSTHQKQVYADYMLHVEKDDSKKRQLLTQAAERTRNLCSQPHCRGELTSESNDYIMICMQCGCTEDQLPDTDVGTFNEPAIHIQPAFAYKKKNHFRDWLAKSQGKENTTIPQVVYDSLLNEFRKLRITRAEDVTRPKIRELLTKLKMPKYYHNISQIHYHITGKRPPEFTIEEETILMEMFMKLGIPPSCSSFYHFNFSTGKAGTRKSSLICIRACL